MNLVHDEIWRFTSPQEIRGNICIRAWQEERANRPARNWTQPTSGTTMSISCPLKFNFRFSPSWTISAAAVRSRWCNVSTIKLRKWRMKWNFSLERLSKLTAGLVEWKCVKIDKRKSSHLSWNKFITHCRPHLRSPLIDPVEHSGADSIPLLLPSRQLFLSLTFSQRHSQPQSYWQRAQETGANQQEVEWGETKMHEGHQTLPQDANGERKSNVGWVEVFMC